MSVKNVIFDYGNTIVEFDPENIVKRFNVTDPDDITLLADKVFSIDNWIKADKGLITQKEFTENAVMDLPERLKSAGEEICGGWITAMPFIPGMEPLIKKLKKDGFGLYLLSNISRHFAENSEKIEIFRLFDGLVFSGAIKMVKPDRDIFEYILDKYSLDPAECVFIDDNENNIRAAEKLGIKSLLFDGNSEKAERFIYEKP